MQPKRQLQPQPKPQPENRSNQHRYDYNPSRVRIRLKPKSASENHKVAILKHGIDEDGNRVTFYEDANGNEVNKYGDPIRYDDDDFADESPASFLPVEKRQTKREKAAELLQKWLRNGPVSVAAIKHRAEAAGISWSTIDKARYSLGLIAAKGTGRGAGWFWILPK